MSKTLDAVDMLHEEIMELVAIIQTAIGSRTEPSGYNETYMRGYRHGQAHLQAFLKGALDEARAK